MGNALKGVRKTRARCEGQATLSKHTSFHSKAAACEASSVSGTKGIFHLFNAGNIVSTAAKQTSVTKVAVSACHRTLDLGCSTGAAALSSPFQFFMMYLISARYKAGQGEGVQWPAWNYNCERKKKAVVRRRRRPACAQVDQSCWSPPPPQMMITARQQQKANSADGGKL